MGKDGVQSLETGGIKGWGEEQHLQRVYLVAAGCGNLQAAVQVSRENCLEEAEAASST